MLSKSSVLRVPLAIALPCVVWVLLLAVFPQIDLAVSGAVYDAGAGFVYGNTALTRFLDPFTSYAAVAMLAGCLGWWGLGKLRVAMPRCIPDRFMAFLLIAFLVGPLLSITIGLKQHWGRERPIEITQFGGTKTFTPYYLPTGSCERDCAFSSGHAGRGFFFVALAIAAYGLAWPHRRLIMVGALSFGLLTAALRIIDGKHFLSDVTFSALIVSYVAWVVFGMFYGRNAASHHP